MCPEDCHVDSSRSKHIVGKGRSASQRSEIVFANAVVAPVGMRMRSPVGQALEHIYVWIHDKTGLQIDFRYVQTS